jgi:hypothetical protein
MARPKSNASPNSSTATIGFEAKRWIAARPGQLFYSRFPSASGSFGKMNTLTSAARVAITTSSP